MATDLLGPLLSPSSLAPGWPSNPLAGWPPSPSFGVPGLEVARAEAALSELAAKRSVAQQSLGERLRAQTATQESQQQRLAALERRMDELAQRSQEGPRRPEPEAAQKLCEGEELLLQGVHGKVEQLQKQRLAALEQQLAESSGSCHKELSQLAEDLLAELHAHGQREMQRQHLMLAEEFSLLGARRTWGTEAFAPREH
mmetsp:Transcript_2739/g.6391  ORF Transcript_2739/g.6391 Transcript_2739/m.6391 type:complete len:199 (-) Transcript_2739:106-702(-)